ncbi:hypothetical protein P691DRAFT_779598 [Macrolepiota fuliginosa MF-IS2]|uniref:Telomere-associated protein Rif1 N-terminal domain-containing protein n=1 Tax=Macrolepiota fuliginosa MF-IS2 TaxID=1400762 RepID=A0A9P6BWK3_9AGAR|nr:hypothetical protein P691DRAFT_779598 [Macrolepiota fuliginosa MF-IS2]
MANGLPARHTNPASPLDCDTYFASPLAPILDSIDDPQSEFITLHDLAESYATLTRRIRSQAPGLLTNVNRIYPALAPFQTNNTPLSLCLIRDISRCLLNPYSIFSQPESASDDDLSVEEGTERAQAYATLSHHALVFLSDVFSIRPVMNSFSASQLRDLLQELLLIIANRHLPTPSSTKTWNLAIWVLTSQRLPPHILLLLKQELKNTLIKLVQGEFDGHSYTIEGLKLFSSLLRAQTSEFMDCLLPLYPSVLSLSTEDTPDVQVQALNTLRCIVSLKLDSPNARWSRKIASHTRSFIKSQAAKHKFSQEGSIQDILSSAMKGDKGNKGPLWASLVIACLICLADADLFVHPHSLKLFLSILAQATSHKRTYIRALHPHIWNCLVWCYSRLPLSTKDLRAGQDFTETRQRAFLVLRQELKGGIAIALVASLLSTPTPSATSKEIALALDVVKDLLSSSKERQMREGIRILGRLVSGVGSSSTADPQNDVRDLSDIVIRDLFVGSFLDMEEDEMKALSGRLPGPDDRFIRPLAENQIRENWKELLQLWAHGVNRTQSVNADSDRCEVQLLAIWQSLLLVQSQLTPNSTFLSTSVSAAEQIAIVITGFITPADDPSAQLYHLRRMRNLWSVIKQSYGTQCLASLAESILSAILKQKYTIDEDGDIKLAWGGLCADLASVGIPDLLHSVLASGESQEGVEAQRHLWAVLAGDDSFVEGKGWEDMLSFLVIPLQSGGLDFPETDIWARLFKRVLDTASNSSVKSCEIVGSLLQRLGAPEFKSLASCPRILSTILPHFHFAKDDTLHMDLMHTVNEVLSKLYPSTADDHAFAVHLLGWVARVLSSLDETNLVKPLSCLKKGLCLWLIDEADQLSEHEHSVLVRDIYCTSLITLSRLPPSVNILQDLSPFLVSSFERIGNPPIGPLAFEQFWRTTYHDQHESLKRLIPDELRICLKAWSDHCGDSLAEGIASGIDSQSTPRSVVLDSQSPNKAALIPGDEDLSRVMDSDGIYELVTPTPGPPPPLEESQHTPSPETPRAVTPKATPNRVEYMGRSDYSVVTDSVNQEPRQLAGAKRPNSQSTPPIPKRRRTEDESHFTRDSNANTRHPQSCPEYDFGTFNPTRWPTASLNPITHPPISSTQPPRTPERHQRPVVPPSPGAEISLRSSPTTFLALQIPREDKGKSRMIYDEDEVVDDSTEMEYLPSLLDKNHEPSDAKPSNYPSTRRLQSEPVPESAYPDRPTPLRRNHTASERLGALERAYTLVAETQGVSQVPVEELALAARLAHEIGARLTEQLTKKLTKGP